MEHATTYFVSPVTLTNIATAKWLECRCLPKNSKRAGLAFASATSSFTLAAGTAELMTKRFCTIANSEIGVKSLIGSYGSLL